MIEVDWQLLFNTFFSSVRVKIQCKDPSKIPRERMFVFKGDLHLIIFDPEGFSQGGEAPDDKPEEDGEDKDNKENDLNEEEFSDSEKREDLAKENEQSEGKAAPQKQGSQKGPTSSRTVRRLLDFGIDHFSNVTETLKCADLLREMDLDVETEEDMEIQGSINFEDQEDEGYTKLPDEWIFELSQDLEPGKSYKLPDNIKLNIAGKEELGEEMLLKDKAVMGETFVSEDSNQTQPGLEELTKQGIVDGGQKKRRGKKQPQWGPVLPTRKSSRLIDNGQTVGEKAQETKRKWNLDDKPEYLLEKYGDASFQDHWDFTKLDSFVSSRQEDSAGGDHRQAQNLSKHLALAAVPEHCLKNKKPEAWEIQGAGKEPWWMEIEKALS